MNKQFLKIFLINSALNFFKKFFATKIGAHVHENLIKKIMSNHMEVRYKKTTLAFTAPNKLIEYRVRTFATKEPETLDWIDQIPIGSVFWDVGANIGLYSCYAAISRQCKVFAFEPSVFNLELLARNISINMLQERICIVPVPLNNNLGPSIFNMTNTDWGGALSTFGQDYDQNGNSIAKIFTYQTLGLSMEQAIDLLKIEQPKYLKIDVDGIEHLILRGGEKVLSMVNSILVEINDNFQDQANESARLLASAGLTLYKKCSLGSSQQYNQWWIRTNQISNPH